MPALVRDVRVRVERDVGDRVAVADEELPPLEPLLECIERRGDRQAAKEMQVFLTRVEKAAQAAPRADES